MTAEKMKNQTSTGKSDAVSAPRILEALVRKAESVAASDLHLHIDGPVTRVAFRLDGLLTPVQELPKDLGERVIGRIKYLARLKTYQEVLPQDGRIERNALHSESDIRVATYPTVTGEKVVLRLFGNRPVRALADLGLPIEVQSDLETLLNRTTGMLLLTGPSGSGKTTTIYACLHHLARQGGRHIVTIEDPAEQVIPGIMQTEINEARGLDFAKAARHLLRQDPQVLVIGEIRDEETAQLAVRAALTGHLVVSTLHAGSCHGVFERLLTLCPDHSAVAACLEMVVNQRLLRRVCEACHGERCDVCLNTGYSGRFPVVEWLPVSESIREQVRQGVLTTITPFKSLSEAAQVWVEKGVTNQRECQRVLGL